MLTETKRVENHDRVVELLNSVERDGISDLLKWLEESDFFTAPASRAYHGAYIGGLCEHSLNVYDEAKRLLSAYPEVEVSDETVIISALLHDLCKVNFYATEKRNRKNSETGQWESYDAFTIKEKFCYGGHGSKSVFLAQNFIKLTPTEAIAINCHMGSWDGNKDVGSAYENTGLHGCCMLQMKVLHISKRENKNEKKNCSGACRDRCAPEKERGTCSVCRSL